MPSENIRSFIAIELPEQLKGRLREFESKFRRPRHTFVKWVAPDSIHLTLKFLGDITPVQCEQVKSALNEIACANERLLLHTGECGCFPNVKRPRVFWLGLGGEIDRLLALQKAVDGATARLGFPSEGRPYTAHLTLARIKDECTTGQRWEFSELIQGSRFEPQFDLEVHSMALMRSQLTPGGAIYTRLGEYHLKRG